MTGFVRSSAFAVDVLLYACHSGWLLYSIIGSTLTAALRVTYNSLTLWYCFVFNINHIKTFCIVQKHVDKRSEYQFLVKNIWKKGKISTGGIRTGALNLKSSELNQATIWTVV